MQTKTAILDPLDGFLSSDSVRNFAEKLGSLFKNESDTRSTGVKKSEPLDSPVFKSRETHEDEIEQLNDQRRRTMEAVAVLREVLSLSETGLKGKERVRLWDQIRDTSTSEEVLDILRQRNLCLYVEDYYSYLDLKSRITGGEHGFELQSLQSWARFVIDFIEKEGFPYSEIRSNRDGCAQLEWRLSEAHDESDWDNEYFGNGRGIVDLTLFPSGLISLSILTGPYVNGKNRISLSGRLSYLKTTEILRLFRSRLQSV